MIPFLLTLLSMAISSTASHANGTLGELRVPGTDEPGSWPGR